VGVPADTSGCLPHPYLFAGQQLHGVAGGKVDLEVVCEEKQRAPGALARRLVLWRIHTHTNTACPKQSHLIE